MAWVVISSLTAFISREILASIAGGDGPTVYKLIASGRVTQAYHLPFTSIDL